jgi:hypothetical protein
VNPAAARRDGPNALDWIETATHLLRSAPAGALLCYYIGSVPCLLGLLYFWTDMSRGAFAAGHLIDSAFSAALLYIWMKSWQAVFFSKLRAHLQLEPESPWTFQRVTRMVTAQAVFAPIGLFLRFIAANLLIPYIWTYSLFIGAAILSDGTIPSLREIARGAVREAGLWWRQTHVALFGLFFFALFIFANLFLVAMMLPAAAHTLFGIESPFTRDSTAMVNSTFVAAVLALTYLCFDPLRKAIFLVRHFQGASIHTGEDLRVALKTIRSRSRLAVAALVLLGTLIASPLVSSRAEEPAPVSHVNQPAPASKVDSSQLSNSLDRVLERREYGWRFPRSTTEETEKKGWLASFIDSAGKALSKWVKSIFKTVGDWWRRLFSSKSDDSDTSSSETDWGLVARVTLVILALALAVGLALLFWRARWGRSEVIAAQSVPIVPDLNQEHVTADQLPEDGWVRLGRELIDKGDLRLALRAFYLATLAHLGQRDLIRLARYKSNLDYDVELQRRARGNASLLQAFDHTLLSFERVWYGDHTVTPEILDGVSQNMERIRAC